MRRWARSTPTPDPSHPSSPPSSPHDPASLLHSIAQQLPGDDQAEDAEPLYLWPDCLPAWNLFMGLQTQWMAGVEGKTGLNYAGMQADLDEAGYARGTPERSELWHLLKVCELALLTHWADARKPPGT